MANSRQMASTLFGVAVGVALLAAVALTVAWDKVLAALSQANLVLLLPIGLLLGAHYLLKGLRWRALLARSHPVPAHLAVRLTMVGFLLNNVFPARIGELGRPYLLSTHAPGFSFSFALATVFADKLFDLLFVVLSLALAALVLPLPEWAVAGICVLTAICFGFFVAGGLAAAWEKREAGRPLDRRPLHRRLARFGPRGEQLYAALGRFAAGLATLTSMRAVTEALFWGALSFALLAGSAHLTLTMFGIAADGAQVLFILGATGVGFMIPSAPTNAGNFHFFATHAVLLLALTTREVAFSFALISHISQVVVVTLLGVAVLPGLDWRGATQSRPKEP